MGRGPAGRRLDEVVVARGLAETRARAQAVIMGGGISVDGTVVTKPAVRVGENARVELVAAPLPYVSRGGLKLKEALDRFDVRVVGKVAVDVGASTGGFTDVLLQEGARRVYAIDVGYGQLAWALRQDARVVVMERTNIKNVERLPEQVDLAVIDVSFISLRQVLPRVRALLSASGEALALIKPQFEAGRGKVGKKGVVRDPDTWRDVVRQVLNEAREGGWTVKGLIPSPIRGPAGNVEFLAYLGKGGAAAEVDDIVDRAISAVDPKHQADSRGSWGKLRRLCAPLSGRALRFLCSKGSLSSFIRAGSMLFRRRSGLLES